MKPNYTDFGLSSSMSLELRKIVEKQLEEDLKFYVVTTNDLYFDWSGSCIEGHLSSYLNSSLENYSGITVYDSNDTIIAEGWIMLMELSIKLEAIFLLLFGIPCLFGKMIK